MDSCVRVSARDTNTGIYCIDKRLKDNKENTKEMKRGIQQHQGRTQRVRKTSSTGTNTLMQAKAMPKLRGATQMDISPARVTPVMTADLRSSHPHMLPRYYSPIPWLSHISICILDSRSHMIYNPNAKGPASSQMATYQWAWQRPGWQQYHQSSAAGSADHLEVHSHAVTQPCSPIPMQLHSHAVTQPCSPIPMQTQPCRHTAMQSHAHAVPQPYHADEHQAHAAPVQEVPDAHHQQAAHNAASPAQTHAHCNGCVNHHC